MPNNKTGAKRPKGRSVLKVGRGAVLLFVVVVALQLKGTVANPVRGREELERLFENGRLLVEPQPQGHYIAWLRG